MNQYSTLLILLLSSPFLQAQTKNIHAGGIEMQVSPVDTSLRVFFCYQGQEPEFPGGVTNLIAYAKGNIEYPGTAIHDHVEGSVILNFVIDKKGDVVNAKISQSVRRDLDSVCLRMLSLMPRWKPGQLGSRPIDVNERWKITFALVD